MVYELISVEYMMYMWLILLYVCDIYWPEMAFIVLRVALVMVTVLAKF